jgi:hypothetical protein
MHHLMIMASLPVRDLGGGLRRSGVTWRLNAGVPAIEIAGLGGHSVEVLMRVYARCVAAWKTSGSREWTPASAERLLRLYIRKRHDSGT